VIKKSAADTTGVRALAAAVRDGELTPEQRTALIGLLLTVDAAARLAPRVREYYPDGDALAVGYLIGDWALCSRPMPSWPRRSARVARVRRVALDDLLVEVHRPG
jgi:hypothetical protein